MPRVIITVPEKTPQPYRFQLDRQSVTMGRGEESEVVIESGSVSVLHAEMRRVPGGYELHDLGSTNGITLDGQRFEVIPLEDGATVMLGDVAFDFSLTEDELKILKSEVEVPVAIPAPRAVTQPLEVPVRHRANAGGGGMGRFLLLVVLLAMAFAGGLAVRYQKETGGSLLEAVKARVQAIK